MSDYYTESQVNRIEQNAHDGAILEAGKEWERQRDEFNSIEHELETRIAELETFIDQLIEAGDWELRSLCAFLDYTEDAYTYKYYDPYGAIRGWSALVKSWKEREE